MRVKYWMPYEAQPHITSDLGEASKLVQAKQATLESVEHEKTGKTVFGAEDLPEKFANMPPLPERK